MTLTLNDNLNHDLSLLTKNHARGLDKETLRRFSTQQNYAKSKIALFEKIFGDLHSLRFTFLC